MGNSSVASLREIDELGGMLTIDENQETRKQLPVIAPISQTPVVHQAPLTQQLAVIPPLPTHSFLRTQMPLKVDVSELGRMCPHSQAEIRPIEMRLTENPAVFESIPNIRGGVFLGTVRTECCGDAVLIGIPDTTIRVYEAQGKFKFVANSAWLVPNTAALRCSGVVTAIYSMEGGEHVEVLYTVQQATGEVAVMCKIIRWTDFVNKNYGETDKYAISSLDYAQGRFRADHPDMFGTMHIVISPFRQQK
jgi:hypothetical protein